jgi:hypothetical protein
VSLKKPSALFISRKATVLDLRQKIAEIIQQDPKENSVKELMSMARIWKLDLGETVLDLEKWFEQEMRDYVDHLPMQINGRVL